jgi:hypothetical protein
MQLRFDLGNSFYANEEFQAQQKINLLPITVSKQLRLEINSEIHGDLLIINSLVKIRFVHAINISVDSCCDILITGISYFDLVLKTYIFESISFDFFKESYNLEIGLATNNGENYLKYIFPDSLLL